MSTPGGMRPHGADAVLRHFRQQSAACHKLGSAFTGRLLAEAAKRLHRVDRLGMKILGWPSDPAADALALRLAGGLHALALSGRIPALAAFDDKQLGDTLEHLMREHETWLVVFVDHPPQTNEVARSAVLMPGFQVIHERTGSRPMRLFELGSSAGLNQHWQAFRYETDSWSWGPSGSPVVLRPDWQGKPPPLGAPVVASASGVDLRPIDLRDAEQQLRLRSYIWPDQPERLQRLDAAIDLATARPPAIEAGSAADWLEHRLDTCPGDETSVIFHSIAWQYFSKEAQQRCFEAMARAGGRGSPVAWLRMEAHPSGRHAVLDLDLWQPGIAGPRHLHLADCHFHGAWVRWIGT
ncbi:MAG: DUF2332 domain-containing protein [Geminicoccaceae bacterium]|nr:DUF2332 domain-containing protein [Geminicoccaceae bacterium]